MRLTRQIIIQFTIFGLLALTALGVMLFGYMQLPALMGVGKYKVTIELPETGGLYPRGNVTYRGAQVGIVDSVKLTDTGVAAVLSLDKGIPIPADVEAQVHSVSSVGEQYVQLIPRSGSGPELRDGDVIPRDRTTVPTDINTVLETTNRGLEAIPRENLQTVIDEAYTAVGGLGPELRRIVHGGTSLAIDARENLDSLLTLVDDSQPILNSQTETGSSIQAWAANLANISGQLRDQDAAVAGVLQNAPGAADETRALFNELQPTLPIVLANLVSLNEVAVAYQPNLEQFLVLLPQGTAVTQAVGVAKKGTKQDYMGDYLVFNLNLNLPPPCTTGFLPAQQQRAPSLQDYPDRPQGDLYCRVPQDAPFNVRGARNTPCTTVPGKRAPTVKMCESDEQYIPLNDGYNWKGDPNATLSGQPVPQLRPGEEPTAAPQAPEAAPAPPGPPIAAAEYDPATGKYVGPDGQVYTQSNLAEGAKGERPWQSLLVPPA
ncbi:MCE family protein [Mycolicibacterium phlei]|jgi:phospholipid/cholesterol/gamma-HCH transport system substrate-binding protein